MLPLSRKQVTEISTSPRDRTTSRGGRDRMFNFQKLVAARIRLKLALKIHQLWLSYCVYLSVLGKGKCRYAM